jgi:hypothetical protein
MAPRVQTVTGELPPFWDRSVLFFCNLRSIFYENDAEAAELVRRITGATSYGGRVISILNILFHRGPNKILLEAPPEPSLLDYFSGDLKLSLPTFEVLDHRRYEDLAAKRAARAPADPMLADLGEHPAAWIDGYVTDAALVRLAKSLKKKTVSSLAGSKNGNNKYLLHRHLADLKLPVFDTFMAARPSQVPARLERQIGASGYGMVKARIAGFKPSYAPEYLFFEGPCMVQGWIDEHCRGVERIGSPSVQMFLNDDTVFLFDWTEQILSDESVHEGNQSPPPYAEEIPGLKDELFRQAGVAGKWLHKQGYRGTASSDFLVVRRKAKPEAILCEINARVTGATYPALLARHFLPGAAWYMRNIEFRSALDGSQLLEHMDRAGELFRPGAEKGIIPFNFNAGEDGKVTKGQFLCVGKDHAVCGGLLASAWSELPVEWGYDRD